MTRSDLVAELAVRFDQLTLRDTDSAVNIILGAMTDSLVRGERVEIRGFGSFSVKQRAARIGRNPRSGASVSVPPQRVPRFKVGKSLRESIDKPVPK
jgi:integration host factor subunit beta